MSSGTGIQHFSVFLNKRRQNKKPYSPPRGILHKDLISQNRRWGGRELKAKMLHQKGHAQVFTTGTGIQRLSHSFSERSKTQFIKLKEREITTPPGYLTFGARHYPSPPNQGGNSAPHIPLTLPANPSAMSSGTGIQHFSVFLNKRRQNKKPYSPPQGNTPRPPALPDGMLKYFGTAKLGVSA